MKSKIVMKTTTFVILLSLVQHSFYIKSNNRAHSALPLKLRKKKQRGRHLGDLGGLTYSTLSPRFLEKKTKIEVTYLKKYKKSCQMCLIVVKIHEY